MSLNIDDGEILNFPTSRMDLLFWMNISCLGENVEKIEENA